jgi:nucleoside-diphosphate-sugar epimerase
LVTGASGFLGRYVVAELTERGHDVTALVRPSAVPPDALTQTGVEVLRGDLRKLDDGLTSRLADHDAIIHLAAATTGTPRTRFDGTVLATEQLLDSLARAGWRGRFVHVSTLAVYAFNQLPHRGVLDESAPLEPELGRRDDYAWTKAWQERVVRRYAETADAEVVIVRPGSIYGPERRFQHRLGRMIGSRVLLLIGGRTPMPLSYVENTASLLATCAEHPRAGGEVLNAIDPDPPSQWRYLRHLLPTLPRTLVIPVPLALYRAVSVGYERVERRTSGAVSAPGFFARYVMTPSLGAFRFATDRPRAVLNWTPPVGTDEALRRAFAPQSS